MEASERKRAERETTVHLHERAEATPSRSRGAVKPYIFATAERAPGPAARRRRGGHLPLTTHVSPHVSGHTFSNTSQQSRQRFDLR